MFEQDTGRTNDAATGRKQRRQQTAQGMTARHALLGLQASVGNVAVVQALRNTGNPWVQETHQHGTGCGHKPAEGHDVQRAAHSEAAAQMKAEVQRVPPADAADVQRASLAKVLSSPGRALEPSVASEMGALLNSDFTTVRIHDDAAAAESAELMGARAYTSGEHVVVGGRSLDRHTLIHELKHVDQQRNGQVAGTDQGNGLRMSHPDDAHEREAEATARALSGVTPVGSHREHDHASDTGRRAESPPRPSVQRSPRTWDASDQVANARRQSRGLNPAQSFWPAVIDKVNAYAALPSDDLDGRSRTLDVLQQAISEWQTNQRNVRISVSGASSRGKEEALRGLTALIRVEREEMYQQRRELSARRHTTAPVRIGGSSYSSGSHRVPGRGSRGEYGSPRSGHSGPAGPSYGASASPVPSLAPHQRGAMANAQALVGAGRLPAAVNVRLHLTSEANTNGIHRRGLVPMLGSGGIGLPDAAFDQAHQPDRDHFYVLSGSNQHTQAMVAADSGGERAVVVLSSSSVSFDRDVNYPQGGSQRYAGTGVPARHRNNDRGPITAVLPLRSSGATADAITAFVNAHRRADERPLTNREVRARIEGELVRKFGPLTMASHLSGTNHS